MFDKGLWENVNTEKALKYFLAAAEHGRSLLAAGWSDSF